MNMKSMTDTKKSLTRRSWLPWCSRKNAMREITEIREDKRRDAARNEMVRANERERHLTEEARMKDIILRIQGYIAPDGVHVMPIYQNTESVVEKTTVRMERAEDTIMIYARLNSYMLGRYGVLTPSDYQMVARMIGDKIGAEAAQIIASGKMEVH